MMALTIASSCCLLASSIDLFTVCQSLFLGRSPHDGFTLQEEVVEVVKGVTECVGARWKGDERRELEQVTRR
ncbi:hypothetical protein E2C01_015244 [Portunus trituberculatus]|uniref:Secreted protein n=1 Tax=Portunus trituberculatus TaxID=210409 RepID=A0A5B7DM27_PORTR|nr:hypothetical protein [Portunus trituberculatus]